MWDQFLPVCGMHMGASSGNAPVPHNKLHIFSCRGSVAKQISSSFILQTKNNCCFLCIQIQFINNSSNLVHSSEKWPLQPQHNNISMLLGLADARWYYRAPVPEICPYGIGRGTRPGPYPIPAAKLHLLAHCQKIFQNFCRIFCLS